MLVAQAGSANSGISIEVTEKAGLMARYPIRRAASGWAVVIAGGIFFALAAGTAFAAPIPGVNTLQDLVDLGHAGVVIGDLRLFDFSYVASLDSSASDAPIAADVLVQPIQRANRIGMAFSYSWPSDQNFNQDSLIRYTAQVLNAEANGAGLIGGIGLSFNGTAQPGQPAMWTIAETAAGPDGTVLGRLQAFDNGPRPGNVDFTSSALTPTGKLLVSDEIQAHLSAAAGGVSTASVFNTFDVPEPNDFGVWIVGLGLFGCRRGSRLSSH